MTGSAAAGPRVGGRVLLLDPADRVLLIHARDPVDPVHHWWELPGGGLDHDEHPRDAARRELAEETGLTVDVLGRELWIRESRFRYRGRDHHRVDHVYLGRTAGPAPRTAIRHSDNERAGLIEHRWWTARDLRGCVDNSSPPRCPTCSATSSPIGSDAHRS